MAGFKDTASTLFAAVSELRYRTLNVFSRSTPVHLVMCGPDDKTAKALFEKLPWFFSPHEVAVVRGEALSAKNVRSRVIISWDEDDASRAEAIVRDLSPTRRLIFVLAVADPHVLVGERSPELPHHFTQGADYRLHVEGRTRSMTKPGVVSRTKDSLRIAETFPWAATVVKREDVLSDPQQVLQALGDTVRKHGGPAGDALTEEGGSGQPGSDDGSDPDRSIRVSTQVSRFPELEKLATSLDYPPHTSGASAGVVSARGLIVAFHTPDEVYRAEAERLRRSLDALGLDYEISVVEPESNWVRTTLLKPTWIAPARERLSGPLLYVDVDAYVHEDPWPYLDDMEADMAARVDPNGQLYSGTLFIADTPGASLILTEWANAAHSRRTNDVGDLGNTGDEGDQGVLRFVVEREESLESPRFRFGRLPPNLATIFDRSSEYRFGPVSIEHLQVSREVTRQAKRLQRRHDRLRELSE